MKMIRIANVSDAAQLCEIYNHYVLNTNVTFEEQAVTMEEMASRVQETLSSLPWLVVEDDSQVLGFSYASKWKGRCAYRYSAEATVYLRPDATGKGLGTQLYLELLKELKDRSLHTVMGGIALPNDASVALHEKLGFSKVAQFRQVGHKFGNWIDVGYWQLLFDPR
jgi:L-amino acid N-acyltransferase YncA